MQKLKYRFHMHVPWALDYMLDWSQCAKPRYMPQPRAQLLAMEAWPHCLLSRSTCM